MTTILDMLLAIVVELYIMNMKMSKSNEDEVCGSRHRSNPPLGIGVVLIDRKQSM